MSSTRQHQGSRRRLDPIVARVASVVVVATVAVAASVVAAAPAVADPDPTYGVFRTYAGVGAPSTGEVWEGLTNGRAAIAGGVPTVPEVASYDATGSATIHTRAGGPRIDRPNDDAEALEALVAHPTQVDFARVTDAPTASPSPSPPLTALPFARDAVSMVGSGLGYDIANFDRPELQAIYTCTSFGRVTATSAGGTVQVDYTNGTFHKRLRPLLPAGTGDVRAFFLRAVGIEAGQVGPCVDQGASVRENDGRVVTADGMIVPFLVSQWIAQKTGYVRNTVGAYELTLTSIDGRRAVTGSPIATTPGELFGQGAYPGGTGRGYFARDVYSVVRTSDLETPLASSLTTRLRSGTAKLVLNRYGFKTLGYVGDPFYYRSTG